MSVLNCRNKYYIYEIAGRGETMSEGKKAYCLTSMLLSLTMLCSIMLVVTAQTEPSSTINSWQPPKNFVDPVTVKIQEFKLKGLDEVQITTELAKLGMGWYPKTGATWMGRSLTSEELARMPSRESVETSSTGEAITSLTGRTSVMRTSDHWWTGIASEIVSGSMSIGSGQTAFHYVCMQLGDLGNQNDWTETVITHNLNESYQWHTFDSDEGGWAYYMDKYTSITTADTYVIMLDGSYEYVGWNYDIWINYQWVRHGHLDNLWAQAGFQKEVYSNTGIFTDDVSHSIFYRNWLHDSQGWFYWTDSESTFWRAPAPLQETHYLGSTSYHWQTWVQN